MAWPEVFESQWPWLSNFRPSEADQLSIELMIDFRFEKNRGPHILYSPNPTYGDRRDVTCDWALQPYYRKEMAIRH